MATFLGLVGGLWWVLDLCAHFRMQCLCGALGLALAFLAMRRWIFLGLSGAIVALNAAVVLLLFLASPETPQAGARPIELVAFNIQHRAGERCAAGGEGSSLESARVLGNACADLRP